MTVIAIVPKRFEEDRGWFCETFNERRLAEAGISAQFCQDNQSLSRALGTLRGLHFQTPPFAQAKLVRCTRGRIFDVAVDIRKASPTFGKWAGIELSAENNRQLFVPAGYAHGFITLEPDSEIAYKVDNYYSAECDAGIAWNDPAIGVVWPLGTASPLLSAKDRSLPWLADVDVDFLYDGVPLGEIREIRF